MSKYKRIQRLTGDIRNSRRPDTSCFIGHSTPSIENIPIIIQPSLYLSLPNFERLAKMILRINPSFNYRWKSGSRVDNLMGDLIKMLNKELTEFSRNNGVDKTYYEVSLVDDEYDSLFVKGFFCDDVFPIYYKESLLWVKSNAPRMERMFTMAIKVIGSFIYTWEDMRIEYIDRINDMIPDLETSNDFNEISNQRDMVKGYQSVGPVKRGKFFDNDNIPLSVLELSIKRFTPSSPAEEKLFEWVKNCVELKKEKPLNNNVEDYIQFQFIFPLLFSRMDDITEEFENNVNYEMQSSISCGVCLQLVVEDLENLPQFLADVKCLGLYERVFSFFLNLP